MTGAEHYLRAEEFLSKAEELTSEDIDDFGYNAELARLHTELAVAYGTALRFQPLYGEGVKPTHILTEKDREEIENG